MFTAVPGTIMMSGSGILTNGKGTRREYGEFNLDELQVCVVNFVSYDCIHFTETHQVFSVFYLLIFFNYPLISH